MGKKGMILLLGFVWILNLTSNLVPVNPIKIGKHTESSEVVQKASFPTVDALILGSQPVIPGFKIDWNLWSNFFPEWSEFLFFTKKAILSSIENGSKSIPFFDVTQTFIHFFHPW